MRSGEENAFKKYKLLKSSLPQWQLSYMESNNKFTVSILGAGGVAWSLVPALQRAGVQVEGIWSRTSIKAERYAAHYQIKAFRELSQLPSSDVMILTVSDLAIASLARQVSPYLSVNQLLLHTSGAVGLGALGEHSKIGVLYPMQAFTRERVVPFRKPSIPVFIEGNTLQSIREVQQIARILSDRVQALDSEARRKLHLGAVIACNFSNLMYRLADELTPEVEFSVFESLIRNQVDLAMKLGPAVAQTGPAMRGDQQTIEAHLDMLQYMPEIREMYLTLSRLINPDIKDPKGNYGLE